MRTLIAFVVIAVAAAALLLHGRPTVAHATAAAPQPAPVAMPPQPTLARDVAEPAPEPPPEHVQATAPRTGSAEPPEEVRIVLDGAREEIKHAARHCLTERTAPPPKSVIAESAQEVRFRFQVTVQGKLGAVSHVERVRSRIADHELERCILATAETTSFPADVDDVQLRMEIVLYVADIAEEDHSVLPPPVGEPPPWPPHT